MNMSTLIRRALAGAFALVLFAPPALRAQGAPSDAVLDEIRSLGVRVQVAGGTANLEGALRTLLIGELERPGILRDLPAHRAGDCCELLLDVRVVEGSAGVPDWGGIAAWSARLELGQSERLGRLDTRMVLWTGRTLGDVVAPTDLADQLRFAARELAVEFVDRYLERFPIR
ncbi:hypothetical protein [Gaopeijia maritima]|uniref:hypothetical protein n=1 Tax=Gaopeijia maritima TaxID=3119007 RepID=UPI00327EA4AF